MQTIDQFITDPDTGILAYLATRFGGDWGGFQLRPYPIGSNNSGWAITNLVSIPVPEGVLTTCLEHTYTVQLGRLLGIPSTAAQINGALLAADLSMEILRWANCTNGAAFVTRISGSIGLPRQNDQIPSNVPGAWWMPIVREFDLTFRDR